MQKRFGAVMSAFFLLVIGTGGFAAEAERTVVDAAGRTVTVPNPVKRVICSGPGALRLLTYLAGQDLVVAVDDIETGRRRFDARPYALATPAYKELPVFGEFRGFDNPERILSLAKPPQVIFKTYPGMGHDPVELQEKTGIPTVILEYGNLSTHRVRLFESLRSIGAVIDSRIRAEAVIDFFDAAIEDLKRRTEKIPPSEKMTCYVGGIAFKGPHGFRSTEPGYPPFMFVNAANVASGPSRPKKASQQVTIAKEQLLTWDPDVLFLDLATLQLEGEASGYWEIRNDQAFKSLTAVREGRVYGVLPYNWYTKNFGSILANAYFIGKVLYPEQFEDVDPAAKADDIYTFLVGAPVFREMSALFGNMAFKAIGE
ncbi:MAG: iron ABC transporter substrate-binding protein [Deltaproteobacteria bacterium]|nr:iron ABC transporter substrate-binding protein [Deltaproteobacteria bacterium]